MQLTAATQKPMPNPTLDQRKSVLVRNEEQASPRISDVDIMPAVGRALCQERVLAFIWIFQLRRNKKGTFAGLPPPCAPEDQPLAHKDTILRAARTVDRGTVNV